MIVFVKLVESNSPASREKNVYLRAAKFEHHRLHLRAHRLRQDLQLSSKIAHVELNLLALQSARVWMQNAVLGNIVL